MSVGDPHRFVNELDASAVDRLIARLENRAKDTVFTRLFDKYAAQLILSPFAQVLEIGCGTGVIVRTLARRSDFRGDVVGVDQSPHFIEAARRFASEENVSDRVAFHVGDAHSLNFSSETFDVVIAHTVMSHVTEPVTVLREMARVVRPSGTLAIFDGDYASLTYSFPNHDFGHRMDVALVTAAFNNPLVMRDLPRLLPELGLQLTSAWGDAVVEIGKGNYFKTFAETYVPYIITAGLLPRSEVEAWLAGQQHALRDGSFFASCNYYTYLARRR